MLYYIRPPKLSRIVLHVEHVLVVRRRVDFPPTEKSPAQGFARLLHRFRLRKLDENFYNCLGGWIVRLFFLVNDNLLPRLKINGKINGKLCNFENKNVIF